jgi:hypothetical protein
LEFGVLRGISGSLEVEVLMNFPLKQFSKKV